MGNAQIVEFGVINKARAATGAATPQPFWLAGQTVAAKTRIIRVRRGHEPKTKPERRRPYSGRDDGSRGVGDKAQISNPGEWEKLA
jgi:hypothetical protein